MKILYIKNSILLFFLDPEYLNAVLCNKLTTLLGWKYPYPVEGKMIHRFPKLQGWLCRQIPYDNW